MWSTWAGGRDRARGGGVAGVGFPPAGDVGQGILEWDITGIDAKVDGEAGGRRAAFAEGIEMAFQHRMPGDEHPPFDTVQCIRAGEREAVPAGITESHTWPAH